MKLLIIGGGNMGLTFAKGFLATHIIAPDKMYILEKNEDKANALRMEQVGNIRGVPGPFIGECDLIILAVKPQDFEELVPSIKDYIGGEQLVLSIMAGINIDRLSDMLGTRKVVRAMPNLPAQIGSGMTVYTSSDEVTRIELVTVNNLLNATGKVVYANEEAMLDAATAVSGSGPAYVFYFMKLLAESARELGFAQAEAELLAFQTFKGAVELYHMFDLSCEDWIKKVTSKGGTTEAAFGVMEGSHMDTIFKRAVHQAQIRAVELSKKM